MGMRFTSIVTARVDIHWYKIGVEESDQTPIDCQKDRELNIK